MSELTLTIIRLGLLVLLWVFVFSVAGVLRGDIYGTRVLSRAPKRPKPERTPAAPPRSREPRPDRKARRNAPVMLRVVQGPLSGTTLSLKATGTLIGRNPECALVLGDDFASGRHARIMETPDGWVAEDLGSTNGTYLDDELLEGARPVQSGSVLRIGKTVIELVR